MDSIDLLRKLSIDDKLRASLVQQGKEQQKRIDDLAKTSPTGPNKEAVQDEIHLARARREEIEGNLTKLRDPSLAILPDHFIWQPVPHARLIRDSTWRRPERGRLELVAGAGTYVIEMPRTDDSLVDIRNALTASGAPVMTRFDRDIVIKDRNVERIKLQVDGSNGLTYEKQLAQAKLQKAAREGDVLYLGVGYDQYKIKIGKTGGIKAALEAAEEIPNERAEPKAKKAAKAPVSFDDAGSVLTATQPEVRWLELLAKRDDATTNLLASPPMLVHQVASMAASSLTGAKACVLSIDGTADRTVECAIPKIVSELRKLGVNAEARDQLVLISHRTLPLELRRTPGKPDSNLLDSHLEWKCADQTVLSLPGGRDLCVNWFMLRQSWLGLLVTWMLLSLGAPFWYDALKDLLKLRSTLAKKEEDDRKDRAQENPKPKNEPKQ